MENPNLALEEIRELIRQFAANSYTLRERDEKAERLCELVRDLDQWISHVGILPEAWDRKYRKPRVFDYTKSA